MISSPRTAPAAPMEQRKKSRRFGTALSQIQTSGDQLTITLEPYYFHRPINVSTPPTRHSTRRVRWSACFHSNNVLEEGYARNQPPEAVLPLPGARRWSERVCENGKIPSDLDPDPDPNPGSWNLAVPKRRDFFRCPVGAAGAIRGLEITLI